jgi:uncharacterized protein (TIGR03067 family)
MTRSKSAWMGLAVMTLAVVCMTVRAAEDKDGGDLKKLEGKWTSTSGEGGKATYSFKGNKLKLEGSTRTYEMTVTLDATAKPEKTIDFKIDEGPEDAKGKTSKGIYKFDGNDKFIFCFRPEGDRPDKYEQVGFEQFVMELTKDKK